MTSSAPNALQKAVALWESGDVDGAWKVVAPILANNPHDALALGVGGHIYEKAGNLPIAYHLFKQAAGLNPGESNAWLSFGRIADALWRPQESERAYMRALAANPPPHTRMMTLSNLAAMKVSHGQWDAAERYAKQALEVEPDSKTARGNLGFAQLAKRNFAEGWKNYHSTLGTDWRHVINYKDEPEWDGTPGQTVVLYGEQGIGDEISFASVIPDAVKDCKRVILDCDARLANLFQRSFPTAKVYGTRMAKSGAKWDEADREFDASLAVGQLGEFYRTSLDQFPGTAYLVADPDRVTMWRALFKAKRKPTIGIAWRGGVEKTGARYRQWGLEQMLPIFRSIDAHWVSLQYKSAAKEIAEFRAKHPEVDLKEYAHGTLTSDYDDTAALVASCDLVICMQTAVAHLAGALGVPVFVAVPKISQWRYSSEGDSIPWYRSLRVFRQRDTDWKSDIVHISEATLAHFRNLQGAAEKAA